MPCLRGGPRERHHDHSTCRVRFLLDENLSDRLVALLADLFPGSRHVKQVGLVAADDQELWEYARQGDFAVLTKDKDFQQLCALRGAPPKVVWLRVGNRTTAYLATHVRAHAAALEVFARNDQASLLILADKAPT